MNIIIVFLIVLFGALQYKLWFGGSGPVQLHQLHQQIEEQQDVNQALKERNAALDAEVKDLKQGLNAIEERARNELGMVKHGEVFYQIVE